MKVIKAKNYMDLSKKAAIIMAAQVINNPRSVLGLATGSTPEGLYLELANLSKEGLLDFEEIKTFNLDEYYGLTSEHPQSYHHFMREKLFQYINIKDENIHIPDGSTTNPEEECNRYEDMIRQSGGIDLQLLGIGRNGHIGFNEPSTDFSNQTDLVNLTEDTIEANQRFFETKDEVPKKAISMGIKTIMQAKKVLLIASGADKKDALERTINQPVTPEVPASILQFHPDVTILYCD